MPSFSREVKSRTFYNPLVVYQLAQLQAVRDEIRRLLLDFFEIEALIKKPGDTLDVETLKQNFADLKQRLKAFGAAHYHAWSFITGLVDVDVGLMDRREARRQAIAYLLTLLPETPPLPEDDLWINLPG